VDLAAAGDYAFLAALDGGLLILRVAPNLRILPIPLYMRNLAP
jgi:hypothetical protein